jgi:predicted nucleic acid-binding protein
MSLVVKDSMILIHLAKITLLESSCNFFGRVKIPELVFEETVKIGKQRGFEDAFLIEELVRNGTIKTKNVLKKGLVKKANQFNVFGGEAEALALYWQEKADFLATDDDNVRKKKEILGISLIGTPAIILALYQKKIINAEKIKQALQKLKKIGWFSPEIIDRILLEVEKNE